MRESFAGFYNKRRVFVTGHTGFKGAWLCLWLKMLGAEVCGYSFDIPTNPSCFSLANVADGIVSINGDIRNYELLEKSIQDFKPDIVIHMAAQSLVRRSFENPVDTFSTNVMGTVHLLDVVRTIESVRAVVNVTSDKCYENQEWLWGYRENDPMGGYDPYSSSKGCSELVSSAYLRSFFNPGHYEQHRVALASARAGNVIGGGDFAEDRLIPDVFRAFSNGDSVHIRSPHAIRPWQHVLEPLAGYLLLAQRLYIEGPRFIGGWNFGPHDESVLEVGQVVKQFAGCWGDDVQWTMDDGNHPHEAALLKLDCSKARTLLGWTPCLNVNQALEWSAIWYKTFRDHSDELQVLSLDQIRQYEGLMI
ncbi:CDP-glucose 4,6-dehydratase [Desulfoluna spongiiphila]|uniref:CDP-glucose 4,6-dehydratase n=2 Tax=Desulfoluna spongiiphila TaxID=419481 RepID=A0A1G5JFJ7_9BACT|nr:CDP-glucose 4,6-dehydratase [Desulfoluna spongiiphila]